MNRSGGRLLLLLALALSGSSGRAAEPAASERFPFFEPVDPPRTVQVMMHRGMATLAPENTLPAIAACAADFVEWAEIDVQLTRDGKHVLLHDATLDRTTTGKGPVAERTLEELAVLDTGAWFGPRFARTRIPTLADALAAAKGKVNLYLDCKRIDPKLLVEEVLAAGMERQVIVYDVPPVLAQVRALSNGKIAAMTKYRPNMDLAAFLQSVRPAAVEIDADDVTRELCERFHRAGVKVQAKVLGQKWDNPAVWSKVVQAGVDWVQTDDAAGFRTWDARQRWPVWPVKIACHRGANRYAPENTLPALAEAARLTADYIEIDIRPTKDGRYILLHDGTLNRTTDGRGPVRDMPFDAVMKLDAGGWFGKRFVGTRVPTFDDGLSAMGPRAAAYLDAKDITPEHLLAAIDKHGLWERHVVYQSPQYCARIKELDARVRTLPPLRSLSGLERVAKVKPYGVDTAWSALSKELIDECHARGIQVFSDAIGRNERVEEYRKAIGWGIDVIQTDHPLRVLRAIELTAMGR
jgi:glycerophosphoryl diester phosphodiesterase